MTLRLVLIVLVAALGFSIPQWPDSQERAGTAKTQAVRVVKNRGPRPAHQLGWGGLTRNRAAFGSIASVSKQGPPIGSDSRVVRPATRSTSNFWRVPSGVHAVGAVAAPLAVAQASKPLIVSFEPIVVANNSDQGLAFRLNRMSEGLGIEIQGPPARLKAPLPSPLAIAFGTGLDDAISRYVRKTANIWSVRSERTNAQVASASVVGLSLRSVLKSFYRGLASIGLEWRTRVEDQVRLAGSLSTSVSTAIRARLAAKPLAVVVKESGRSAEVPLPGDVFASAPVSPAPVAVAQSDSLPEDVFASAPISPAPIAVAQSDMLPEEVFASVPASPVKVEVAQSPLVASSLPEDVFAPVAAPAIAAVDGAVSAKQESTETVVPATKTTDRASRSEKTVAPDRITKAVSLTRDAAVAWMKVFSGSAVVTLHR